MKVLRNNVKSKNSKKFILASTARCGEKEKNSGTYEDYARRIQKTLYFGKLPSTDRPSLSMTELLVKNFGKLCKQDGLDQLGLHEASSVCYEACVTPCSVIVALLYLDRLRTKNPEYLTSTSPSQVFIAALMVASKFLYDDGEEDEVFNDEWAKSAALTLMDLNEAEKNFLSAIDWNLFVDVKSFMDTLVYVESAVAINQGNSRGYFIYSDLVTLSNCLPSLWTSFLSLVGSAVVLCIIGYTASVLVIVTGTAATKAYSLRVANQMRLCLLPPISDNQPLENCSMAVQQSDNQLSYSSLANDETFEELTEKLEERVMDSVQTQSCFSSKVRFTALRAFTTALLLASSSEAVEHPYADTGVNVACTPSHMQPFYCYNPLFPLVRESIVNSNVSYADGSTCCNRSDCCQNYGLPVQKPPSRRKWRKPKKSPVCETDSDIQNGFGYRECPEDLNFGLTQTDSSLGNNTPDHSLTIYAYLNYTRVIIDYIEEFVQSRLAFSSWDHDTYTDRKLDHLNNSPYGISDSVVTLPNYFCSFLPSDESPPDAPSLLPSWISFFLPFSTSKRQSDYVAVDWFPNTFALLK